MIVHTRNLYKLTTAAHEEKDKRATSESEDDEFDLWLSSKFMSQ